MGVKPIQTLLIELLLCLSVGSLIGALNPGLSSRFVMPLIDFGVPISVMGLLLQVGLDFRLLKASFLAVLMIGLLILLLRTIPKVKLLISRPTLQLASAFGNTGYLGIPVALALIPNQALPISIGYDLGATLLIWSMGPLFLREGSKSLFSLSSSLLIKALLASPAAKGLIGALIMQSTPWGETMARALWGPSQLVIVLALLAVGIRFGSLWPLDPSFVIKHKSLVHITLFIKLIAFPLFVLAICLLFQMPSLSKEAFVMQAATPTAISVLLISEANGKDQDIAAVVVVLSTLTSVMTIPLWSLALHI